MAFESTNLSSYADIVMESDRVNQPPLETVNPSRVIIPTEILLGLVTAPLLFGVLCGKATLEFMQSVGEASEEVFRGDRLPVINIPDSPQQPNQN